MILDDLTDEQRATLTPEQIQQLPPSEYRFLKPTQVVHLTSAQIAAIPDTATFNAIPYRARLALRPEQIRALPEHLEGVVFVGSPEADRLIGNRNINRIMGGAGDDLIRGCGGNDYIDGGPGNDIIETGDGRDTIVTGGGHDMVHGGGGADTIIIDRANPGDVVTVDGGGGVNTLDITAFAGCQVEDDGQTLTIEIGGGSKLVVNYTNIDRILM